LARLFTLQEAEELLPEVERWLRAAIECKKNLSALDDQMRALLERVNVSGGVQVDVEAAARMKSGRQQAIEQSLADIGQTGVLVKDLDIGLIDFPTLLDGSEVYLCWKLGEPHIGFWHHTTEGYKERKSIDRDFIDRHKGGRPH
jgi:hypothetical protein